LQQEKKHSFHSHALQLKQNLPKPVHAVKLAFRPCPASLHACQRSTNGKHHPILACLQGKENTGSTDPVHEKSGQEGLNHPQSGAWEGGLERSCTSNTPTPSVPGSLATSPLSTTPGQLSLGPGACSVKPKNDPHAVGEDAGEVQPVCGAGGRSEGQKKEHEVSFGEGDAAPTFDKPQQ